MSINMYPNGVSRAKTLNRSDLPKSVSYTQKSDNVIGLDFGTSTLAVSFVTSGSKEPYKFRVCKSEVDHFSPTVLLIDENGKVDIGSKALMRYTKLQHNVSKSTFFEQIKLELQHDKVNLLHIYVKLITITILCTLES